MKRIICLIVSSVILLMCGAVYSTELPIISVSGAAGKPGDTVKVDVSISNNPGIASYRLKPNFDNTKLMPMSVSGEGITSNIQQTGVDLSSIDYVTVVWANESDLTDNGVLFSVYFKIISDSAEIIPINLSYTQGDICNQNLDDVLPVLSNGAVTVNTSTVWTIDSYNGNTVTVTAPANAKDGEREYVCIAKYNSGNMLIDCEVIRITAQAGKSIEVQCAKNIRTGSGEIVKIMLWDSSLSPLAVPLIR